MKKTLKDIARHIETIAPLDLAEPWDNCGWQVYCGQKEISKVLVTLTVTREVLDVALEDGFDLIVSHHPVIFKPINKIHPCNLPGSVILKSVQAGISIYAAHTNLDKVNEGVSDILAKKLGLLGLHPLLPEKKNPEIGMGRIGHLEKYVPLYDFLDKVKTILSVDRLKVVNSQDIMQVKTIALCGGAGASLIEDLPHGIDLYLTGDIKYHDALEAVNFVLVDAYHSNTEQFIVDKLVNHLQKLNIEVESIREANPWTIY